ncbi:hypothetical protein CLCR_04315 [Cladophialophora carrionii]|uniref:Uncharacterized protein n=1 Tax=Cladophialophora carrionii TaxID=86049 RepID=A0A1C1CJJ5_9EURO|nr:hypothetical protein CLCR_04315 [Cladophialophora carrionii]
MKTDMYQHSPDYWWAVDKVFTDPYSATIILAAVTTTIGTCLCARIVRNKCHEVAPLAQACPQHVVHGDFRYLNVWGDAQYRHLLDHINVHMLQARDCALYAPLLSLIPPAMASPWFYYVSLASPQPSHSGPEFGICLFVSVCWLIQRAVFGHGLTRYFATIETHQASFDLHGNIRSKRDEVAEATGLSFVYLWVLLAFATSSKPSSDTTGWLAAELAPFFNCQTSGRGRPRQPSLCAAGSVGSGQTVYTYGSFVWYQGRQMPMLAREQMQ